MRACLSRFVIAAAACVACAPAEPTRQGAVARNLILISIDTLRADRLGFMGYERGTSPELDDFAARGVVFERAITESSWTLPAHVTMLTGLAPSSHGVVLPAQRVRADTPLLAEVLKAEGFRTWGLTGGVFVSRRHGFERGFEVFEDVDRGLAHALSEARGLLERAPADERFFLFLHTYDVHCPYEPTEDAARQFASPGAEFIETKGRCGNPDFNSIALSAGQVTTLSDRYDASIHDMDAQLGAFLSWLDTRGAFDDTLVVFTSDHGESFYEHGQIGHERSVYREVIQVPLVFMGAGVGAGRVAAPAGLADVFSSTLDLLGVGLPEPVDGRSWAAAIARPAGVLTDLDGAQFSELSWQADLHALVTDSHQLVLDARTNQVEVLSMDNARGTEWSPQTPELARDLEARLRAHIEAHPRRSAPIIEPRTPAEAEQLRALGYF